MKVNNVGSETDISFSGETFANRREEAADVVKADMDGEGEDRELICRVPEMLIFPEFPQEVPQSVAAFTGRLTLTDPVFGELAFHKGGWWECMVPFLPIASNIGVVVEAGTSGPTEEQRKWFRTLEARYSVFLPQIVDRLMLMMDRYDKLLTRAEAAASLRLLAIAINECEPHAHRWEVMFYLPQTAEWGSVAFVEWQSMCTTVES